MNFTKQDLQRLIDKKLNDKEMEKIAGTKHFDCVLINPPYDKTLHLKFIEKCLDISKKIICVHPIDRLVSPILVYKPYFLKAYKRYEPLLKHCQEIEKIDASKFNIALQGTIGITIWDKSEVDNWAPDKYVAIRYNKDEIAIIKKIMHKITDENNGENNLYYFVKHHNIDGKIIQWVPAIHGHVKQDGGKKQDYYEIYSTDYKKAISVKEPKNREDKAKLVFNTEEERKNFINSTHLLSHKIIVSFWKTDVNTKLQFIPWLHNYTKPITNETIMNFFNLTSDEKKTFMNIKLVY